MAKQKQRIYTRYKPEKAGSPKKPSRTPWLVLLLLLVLSGIGWGYVAGKIVLPEAIQNLVSKRPEAPPTEPAKLPPLTTRNFSTEPVPIPIPMIQAPAAPVKPEVPSLKPIGASPTSAKPPLLSPLITHAGSFAPRSAWKTFEVQIALARRAISPGILDGLSGPQTVAALKAFQISEGLEPSGTADAITKSRLVLAAEPYTSYIITQEDLGRVGPVAKTWVGKAAQEAMTYEDVLELIAEKSHAFHGFITRLNPDVDWKKIQPGTQIKLPRLSYPEPTEKAAFIRIWLSDRNLQAFGAATNLLAHFPCSIAAKVEKRPEGKLRIINFAANPNYTFDPAMFPESPEARTLKDKLTIQPGPNNPVGTAWIGLDRPGYGIHGTPKPEKIGRTESHGCFRLANWDASHLLKLVTRETVVIVEP
jgi:lipoprotein-anchoring transpeptidase ErfK/SrfK